MPIRRPAPDPGVIAAVESCQSNTKMKRMVMFGLRALSELCTPPRGRYKESALDAVGRGITATLVTISTNMGDDEEVMELVMKVCWGISQGLEDYGDTVLAARFVEEGGAQAAAAAVNAAPNEPSAVMTAFGMLEAFSKAGVYVDAAETAPGMMKALANPNLTPAASLKVAAAINTVAHSSGGAAALATSGAVDALIAFATIQSASSDPAAIDAVYNALTAAGCISRAGGGGTANVMATKSLIEKNKGRKKIVDAGCEALAGMLTLEQLSEALEALTYPSGSVEKDNALEVLSAMSYIQTFAEAIIESGSVSLLVQATNSTHEDLAAGNRDDTLMKGLVGTVSLLGRISRNPAHAAQVYEAGGLTAIATTLSLIPDHPESFGACCSALAALASSEEYGLELYSSYNVTTIVLPTLYEHADVPSIQENSFEILCAISQHEALRASMIEESAVEIISYSMQYAPHNLVAQKFALQTLVVLVPNVYTTSSIYEYGGFQGIAQALSVNVGVEEIAVASLRVLSVLAHVADAKNFVTDGTVVDSVLYAMLEHSTVPIVTESGKEVLEDLATAQDAERHVKALDSALADAASNSEGALKALAAACGLSRVQRLTATFEHAQVAQKILQHLKTIINNPSSLATIVIVVGNQKITLQEKLMRAAITTVETMSISGSGSLDEIIPGALTVVHTDKLNAMIHANASPNTPEYLFESICKMASLDRMSEQQAIEQGISGACACLVKFSDYRSLSETILEIIHHLVAAKGGAGVPHFFDKGGKKAVLDHIKKTPYSLKAQVNGLRIISSVLQKNPDYVEGLRSCGTVDIVQTALRTHQKSNELRDVVAPIIAQLIPASEMEEIAGRNISIMRDALDVGDYKRLLAAMKMCNDIGVCPEGARGLARQGAAKELRRIGDIEGLDADKVEVYSSAAQMSSLMGGQRQGQIALTREGILNTLLKLLRDLSDAGNEEGILHSLNGIGRILKGDPGCAPADIRNQLVKLITKTLEDYPHHPTIVPAACRVLGALARTDEEATQLVSEPEIASMVAQYAIDIPEATKSDTKETLTRAIADLVQLGNPTLSHFVASQGLTVTLMDELENSPENPVIVRNCAEALDKIGRNQFVNIRDFWESQKNGGDLKTFCEIFSKCIQHHMNDRDVVVHLMNALARFPNDGETAALKEAGMFDIIREVMAIYPDEEAIESACAEMLETVNASDMIEAYMQQLVTADANGDLKSKNDAMENLNVLLLAPIPDAETTLVNEEAVWVALNRTLQSARDTGDLKTMRNVMITAQRLVDQGKVNEHGYRGAWNASQHLLPTCVEMLETGEKPMQTKRLITAMMNTLAGIASNPNTHQLALDTIPINKLIDMLEVNQADIDTTAAITGLLYFMGMDDAGIDKIKGEGRDIVPLLANIMRTHRTRAKVIVPGMGLLEACAKPGHGATSPAFLNGDAIRAADRATGGGVEAQTPLDANLMQLMGACVKNPEIKSKVKDNGILIKSLRRLDASDSETIGTRLKLDGVDGLESVPIKNHYALARMMEAYGVAGEGIYVREKGGMQKLIDMLDEFLDSPKVYNATLDAIAALALSDPKGAGSDMMEIIVPKLFGPIDSDEIVSLDEIDEESEIGKLLFCERDENNLPSLKRCWAVIKLLEAIKEMREGGDEFIKRKRIQQMITVCETTAEYHEDEELQARIAALRSDTGDNQESGLGDLSGQGMHLDAPKFEADVDPEDPNALTLKEVHDWLKERLDNNLSIDVNDASEPLLYERFTFVFTKMTDYNNLQLVPDDFAGYQSQWGCKAWSLWVTYTPDILPTLLEWGVHTLLFDYINTQTLSISKPKQKEVVIATPPSATLAVIGGVRDPGAVTLSAVPNVAADCTKNINFCTEDVRAHTDNDIIPRCSMVETIAVDRTIFKNPEILYALLGAWDLYDSGVFSTLALRHVFRALRRVVCDNHTDAVIERNVTQRLIDELKKDFDNPLLIDGFFLLGVLSVDNRLKTIIGEQRGVEETLTILANHMEDPPGEGVVTNSQLALANLVVGHRKNCNIFHRYGGLQLNVRVLNERGEHFDETNAASALLTNACFRREDIKAAYGEPAIGAPSALAYAISCYDGGTDQAALRCLSNMFKAISNMSLYTPNVDLFLESGLENAYYNLLVQSAGLPDDVVKTGLFTLSNLTWENKTENMIKFGIIIPPLIEMASQGSREDPLLLGSSLETLAFLCRLPENSGTFAQYGGVRLAITLLTKHGPKSSYILQQAVGCLGTAARLKDNASYLVQENCLPVLKQVLEGEYYQDEDTQQTQLEVSLTTLRVIRRVIMAGGAELAGSFGQIGGTASLVWYLESVAGIDDPLPQLAVESLRCLISVLAMGQGDDPDTYGTIDDIIDNFAEGEKKKGGWFGGKKDKDANDDSLGLLEKPETPRGYEVIGLDGASARQVVQHVTTLAQHESLQKHFRFIRCALGWFAYLAAENIPGADTVLLEFSEIIGGILRSSFEELGGSKEMTILTMAIFGNLGYHHGEEFTQAYGKESVAYKTAVELGKKVVGKEKEKLDRERTKKLKDRFDEFLLAWKSVADGDSGEQCFRKFASYETDFPVIQWHLDPYPNGVHDLPNKEELRTGGRFKIVIDEKSRDSFFWRANQTLALLQWRIEKDKNVETEGKPILEFNAGVPVSKISCVTKGLGNELLRKAAKKQRGISVDLCFAIQGPATEDYPSGFDFGIKCKTKAERDQFIEWLLEWRDACSY